MKQHPDGAPLRSLAFPIRWRIFSFLFGFGFLAYVQQKTITVAAEPMMPALGLSQLQISYIEQAFVLGYAVFQLPGGIIGQRLGARLTFVVIGITAFLATLAMPLVPEFFQGPAALFAALFGVQLVLGVSQGAIFPISAGVFEAWFPPSAGPSCRACRRRGSASARHSRRRSSSYLMAAARLAARTGVGEPAGARRSSRCGHGMGAIRRASIRRSPRRSWRRSDAQPRRLTRP